MYNDVLGSLYVEKTCQFPSEKQKKFWNLISEMSKSLLENFKNNLKQNFKT